MTRFYDLFEAEFTLYISNGKISRRDAKSVNRSDASARVESGSTVDG